MTNTIIKRLRHELVECSDSVTQKSFQKFFREKVNFYGVKTGIVGKIAQKYWKEIKEWDKPEIFRLCEQLYASGICEEAFVVSHWIPNLAPQYTKDDFPVFRSWIEKYISNWAECDGFCNHSMGDFIEKYPEYINELKKWTKSNNRWLKRAAAVTLIIPAKRGKYLTEVFNISDRLMDEEDDMVQKGYGWLLKEASRLHQKEVFEYVMENRKKMPRTALRYAIELMPQNLRKKAMERK